MYQCIIVFCNNKFKKGKKGKRTTKSTNILGYESHFDVILEKKP